jgi:hypothetical protein
MKPRTLFILSWVILAMLSAPTALSANTNSTQEAAKGSQVLEHLSAFEQQAVQVNRDAETLLSLARDRRISWESNVYYLSAIREGIDDMGRMLAELEGMKPQACEVEQTAIEKARPHLVALAQETAEAIKLARPGSLSVRRPEYQGTVAELSRHADGLYRTLDTIVDYHNTHNRLQDLEPPHSASEN